MLKKLMSLTYVVGVCCVGAMPVSANCLRTCNLERQVCELSDALSRCQAKKPSFIYSTPLCQEQHNQCASQCPRFSPSHAATTSRAAATSHAATTGYRPGAR